MTPLISAYVVYACLLGLTTALAALCASQRARQWFFAQVWASGGGASRVDAKLRDAKRTLLRGIAGRVLDVGSGEGVNLQYGSMVNVTAHCPDLLGPTARAPGCATHSARAAAPLTAQWTIQVPRRPRCDRDCLHRAKPIPPEAAARRRPLRCGGAARPPRPAALRPGVRWHPLRVRGRGVLG